MLKKIGNHFLFLLNSLRHNRKNLRNTDFTLICNNCVAGIIYNNYGLRFNSPTINLYFFMPDYLKFLQNFNHYIQKPLQFKKVSKYYPDPVDYPLGYWDDIEIHFIHFDTPGNANIKWEERKKRINPDNLFIIGSDRDKCTPELIEQFEQLPFKNKIFFTSIPYGHYSSALYIDKYKHEGMVGDMIEKEQWLNYMDFTHWFNTGVIKRYYFRKQFYNFFFS